MPRSLVEPRQSWREVIANPGNPVLESPRPKLYSYGSIPGLKALARLEFKIFQYITSQLFSDSSYSRSLVNYLQDYKECSLKLFHRLEGSEDERIDKLTWDPICSFRMVWRFEKFIKQLITSGTDSNDAFLYNLTGPIQEIYDVNEGPVEKDLDDAMLSIINIQFVYDINAEQVARGQLRGAKAPVGVTLTALLCTEISKHAVATGFYHISVEWAELAVSLVRNGDTSVDPDDAKEATAAAILAHDKGFQNLDSREPSFYDSKIEFPGNLPKRLRRKTLQYEAHKFKIGLGFAHINYWGICQGRSHQSLKIKSKLFCWYERKVHPSWTMGPLKAEMVSLYSKFEVVQYHDVLADKDLAELKSIPAESFTEATFAAEDLSSTETLADSKSRISTTAWLPEEEFEISKKISELTERITGLKVLGTHLEDLQVGGYTPGGHYVPHTDTMGYHTEGFQARIATLMFYLSDTVTGGGTAFCQGGAHVIPKKGSAIFWYSLYTSGDVDELTWHGACPLVVGEKWGNLTDSNFYY